jgi:GYF domain 2
MKPSEFYILRDGQSHGPYTRDQLCRAVFTGEIAPDTPYSYDRARKWRPLTHLIGAVNPQAIEDNRKHYFVFMCEEVKGPYSYNELKEMIKGREVTHQTLYALEGSQEWSPLSKLPLPRIPTSAPPADVPHESEWEKHAQKTVIGTVDGMTLSATIGFCWTDDAYYIWQMHGQKSSVAGRMYVGGPVRLEYLREMFARGEVRLDTPCARSGSAEWLTVKDYLQ